MCLLDTFLIEPILKKYEPMALKGDETGEKTGDENSVSEETSEKTCEENSASGEISEKAGDENSASEDNTEVTAENPDENIDAKDDNT